MTDKQDDSRQPNDRDARGFSPGSGVIFGRPGSGKSSTDPRRFLRRMMRPAPLVINVKDDGPPAPTRTPSERKETP